MLRLKKLDDKDIRGPGKEADDPSHGRFEPSWIWMVPRVPSAPDMDDSEENFDDSMRVEWAKTKAWCTRWEEEVVLIEEEMRRVIVFLEWRPIIADKRLLTTLRLQMGFYMVLQPMLKSRHL